MQHQREEMHWKINEKGPVWPMGVAVEKEVYNDVVG